MTKSNAIILGAALGFTADAQDKLSVAKKHGRKTTTKRRTKGKKSRVWAN